MFSVPDRFSALVSVATVPLIMGVALAYAAESRPEETILRAMIILFANGAVLAILLQMFFRATRVTCTPLFNSLPVMIMLVASGSFSMVKTTVFVI